MGIIWEEKEDDQSNEGGSFNQNTLYSCTKNVKIKAFEMTQQVKAHATKPDYMSSSPWMHKMEGEAWLLKSVL